MKKAAYDTYDYPSYWENRDYEHESEVLTLKEYLTKIPKIDSFLDLGCGYGRLLPYYVFRAKKVVLADPSSKLLEEARDRLKQIRHIPSRKMRSISFIQTTVEEMRSHFKKKQFDAIMMVRVMHHLQNPSQTLESISQTLKPGGYLILEFANKIHGKALLTNVLHGNFTFPIDIFPADRKSEENKRAIPFLNYHPDVIKDILEKNDFKILQVRSVSNIRSPFLKKHLPVPTLISIEKVLQKPLSRLYFGPSIFILARKRL